MKELTFDRAFLYDIVLKDKRHPHYDYILERTDLWRAIVSGKGLDKRMYQFQPRESDEMFAQRVRITQQITSAVCGNVCDIEYKVPRSNSIQRVIVIPNEKQKEAFYDITNNFWGDQTLNDYTDIRWIELNDTDPNAFVVLEWGDFEEDEYAQPYPFEVHSENAIMYEYDNNVLQYLVSLFETDGLKTYTAYFPNFTIVLSQLSKEEAAQVKIEEGKELIATDVEGDEFRYVRLKDKIYLVSEPKPHELGYVPAYQPGYVRDMATDGQTFLPPWRRAESVLMNLVKSKSELDLTIALHVFPQKLQYVRRCGNTGCNDGRLPDGAICPKCKGVGFEVHTTAQDAIYLPLPKHKDEMLDITGLVHYVYPPVDLVKFMDEYVDKLSQRAMQFVFNSEIYSRESVAETATGKEIDMQAVYDTLYPMAKAMSRDWEFMVETIGDITTIEVEAAFTFSKDFKLKSLDGYYADLQMMGAASPFVKQNIEDDIARITYADNPEMLNKYFTQKAFFPFPGDTPETISLKMAQSHVPKFYKVLYSVYGFVFDELERENPTYYSLARSKQWELLKKKVEMMIPEEVAPVLPLIEEVNNE